MNLLLTIALTIMAAVNVHCCPSGIDYDAVYDLSSGSTTTDPDIVQHIGFSGSGCSKKGVLKIKLASTGTERRRILVDMEFEKPKGWTFNLGGSRTNNGYGGDSGTTVHDAEIHSLGSGTQSLMGYKSDVGGSGLAFSYGGFFRTRLTLIVGNNQIVMLPDNHNKFNYYDKPGMFDLTAKNVLYLGINRSIGGAYRSGSGLCKVSLKFLPKL